MSKYNDMSNRVNRINDVMRAIRTNPNKWLVNASYPNADKNMEYYHKLCVACENYIDEVTAILEEQRKADQVKIDFIEELLSE